MQACDELCSWIYAMDYTMAPVHMRDIVMLADTHPDVHREFMKGNFVVQKSAKRFSHIDKKQSREKSNKSLQAYRGA